MATDASYRSPATAREAQNWIPSATARTTATIPAMRRDRRGARFGAGSAGTAPALAPPPRDRGSPGADAGGEEPKGGPGAVWRSTNAAAGPNLRGENVVSVQNVSFATYNCNNLILSPAGSRDVPQGAEGTGQQQLL